MIFYLEKLFAFMKKKLFVVIQLYINVNDTHSGDVTNGLDIDATINKTKKNLL